MDSKEKLRQQLNDSAGSIFYTYSAHWNIVNRLKKRYTIIKVIQIILTALSTGGFLASIIARIPLLNWIGCITSAIALALNLYMLNFNLPDNIKNHTDAANELWDVREAYKSLLVDFDDLELNQIRSKRDALNERIGQINNKYPGTDNKSFNEARADIEKYEFKGDESEKILNIAKSHGVKSK